MSSPSYHQPGLAVTDRTFTVPLDHADPGGPQIEVFAREVTAAQPAAADLPWLVYLQGGPGFGADAPVSRDGWLDRALRDYRVLCWTSAAPAGPPRPPGRPWPRSAPPAPRPTTWPTSGPTRSWPTPS
jgi:hypothetical protein